MENDRIAEQKLYLYFFVFVIVKSAAAHRCSRVHEVPIGVK